MPLPRRNPIVLFVYSVAIIGMFAFMIWVSLPLAGDSQSAGNASEENISELPVSDQARYLQGFIVSGRQHKLDLSADTTAQITRFWEQFANRDIAGELPTVTSAEKIYAVYHDYNPQENSVYITLGYRTPQPLQKDDHSIGSARVHSGHYSNNSDNGSVLDAWLNSAINANFKFESDFEVYVLDSNHEVTSREIWTGVNTKESTGKKGVRP